MIGMSDFVTMTQIDEIVRFIRSRVEYQPRMAMILGSGLGDLARAVEQAIVIPYDQIPGWPVATVMGHKGSLVVGKMEGQEVLVMQGRVHYYEGYNMAQVTLPVRVLKQLGVDSLIVTNAAGAVNPDYEPGDLMLIQDHLNLIGMAGLNPLRGPNLDEFGPRFPDMSQAYDRQFGVLARQIADEKKITLREGVYVCLSGPSFETPADLRFLRMIGADAVGMSTVPEVTVARHSGMRVLGISGISNKANLDGNTLTTHDEVLEAGKKIVPKLTMLIREMLKRFSF
jgi:purine-nucleoside phosphorylase